MLLAQIEGFLEVARRGNVSRSARALSISQPALTARLRALEDEIGQPLFVRGARGVHLSEAGQAFLPYAEQSVAALISGIAQVGDIGSGKAGQLIIGAAPAVSTYALPHVLVRFAARYPAVRLVVRTGHSEEIVDMVVRRDVHAGLVRHVRHPLIEATPLFEDELVLVSGPQHALADGGTLTREQLAEAPLILFDRTSSFYELTTALFRESGIRPRGVMELDNIDAAKKMVAAGLGVALLPRTAVADELDAGTLVAGRIQGARPEPRRIVVVRRVDAPESSGILADFLSLLAEIPALVPGASPPRA